MTEATVGRDKLEVVPSFCCPRDCLSWYGSCELASITRCHVAWGKFSELWPILTSHWFPTASRGRVYNSSSDQQFSIAYNAMIGLWSKDQVSSQDLERMQLGDLAKVLHTRRFRYHGPVKHRDRWLKKVQNLNSIGWWPRWPWKKLDRSGLDCLTKS